MRIKAIELIVKIGRGETPIPECWVSLFHKYPLRSLYFLQTRFAIPAHVAMNQLAKQGMQ